MKRLVIGSRNRVLAREETHFVSGAALIADFDAHRRNVETAGSIVWAWYGLDATGRPDLDGTLRGTEALLNKLQTCRTRLIFLSTDAVFSGFDGPYAEDDTPDPQTDYARVKWAQERLMANFASIFRFTTFGPSYNSARPLLVELIAKSAVTVARPRQLFSPISTESLNRVLDASVGFTAASGVYHLTSEPVVKTDLVDRLAQAMGVRPPEQRALDPTPLNLALTSCTHTFSLESEIDLAVERWRLNLN